MKFISTVMMGVVAMVVMFSVTGCATARDAMQKEYQRLASTPPAPVVRFPEDRAIDNLGLAVNVNYVFAHKTMKEYVDATENNREYIAFLNDIEYFMETENLDEKAATEKVVKGIMEQDAKITDPEAKVWPRVVKGIYAVDALKPEKKIKELGVVLLANAQALSTITELRNSFTGFDAPTLLKIAACVEIGIQVTFTAECLMFLTEQYRRTLVAKYYAK